MASRLSKILWFGVSTAIILGMIYFADISRFIDALGRADKALLVPAFVFGLSVFFVWSYVWHSFFRKMGVHLGYLKSLKMFMAGHFMNSVTPAGQLGGEPFMAYVISRKTDLSYEESFSTVLSADIVNAVPGFTFIAGGAAYLLFFGSFNRLVLQTIYIAIFATVVGGSIVYLLWFKSGKIERGIIAILNYLSGKLGRGAALVEKIEEKLRNIEDAFKTIGESPRHLIKVTLVSHLSFLFQLGCIYFILLSLGVEADLTPLYFVLTLADISNYSPTPGGSGAYEAAMAGLLTFFVPITFAPALAAGIIFRMTTYWPGLVIGYLSLHSLEKGGE